MKLTYLSKDDSLALKGAALLMMVFLHLFNTTEKVSDCFNLFSIDGEPLVTFLSHSCNPVGFYLFFSGYGLYYLHLNGKFGGGKTHIPLIQNILDYTYRICNIRMAIEA